MSWSTRELADIAGTTVNTVRHYHSVGLLESPERRYNGYKQYRIRHLVRLIRVRRLAELGVPLSQVRSDEEGGLFVVGGLQQLAANVREEINRLHQTRSDIAALVLARAPVDAPRGFERLAARLSDPDRSLIHIHVRLHDDDSVVKLREMVQAESDQIREEFYSLRSTADETTSIRLARQIRNAGVNWRSLDRPWLDDAHAHDRIGARRIHDTIAEALQELYTAAQLDVINRAQDARRTSGTFESEASIDVVA